MIHLFLGAVPYILFYVALMSFFWLQFTLFKQYCNFHKLHSIVQYCSFVFCYTLQDCFKSYTNHSIIFFTEEILFLKCIYIYIYIYHNGIFVEVLKVMQLDQYFFPSQLHLHLRIPYHNIDVCRTFIQQTDIRKLIN